MNQTVQITIEQLEVLKKAFDSLMGQRGTYEQEEGVDNELLEGAELVIDDLKKQLNEP